VLAAFSPGAARFFTGGGWRTPALKDKTIQLCDALLRNISNQFETVLCDCLSRGPDLGLMIARDLPLANRAHRTGLETRAGADSRVSRHLAAALDRLLVLVDRG
jgi:hypothetical protein